MAEGNLWEKFTDWRGEKESDFQELQAFSAWYVTEYGMMDWLNSGLHIGNFKDSEQYGYWIRAEKPTEKFVSPEDQEEAMRDRLSELLVDGKLPYDELTPEERTYVEDVLEWKVQKNLFGKPISYELPPQGEEAGKPSIDDALTVIPGKLSRIPAQDGQRTYYFDPTTGEEIDPQLGLKMLTEYEHGIGEGLSAEDKEYFKLEREKLAAAEAEWRETLAFEKERDEREWMAEHSGARDWIQRWMYEHGETPEGQRQREADLLRLRRGWKESKRGVMDKQAAGETPLYGSKEATGVVGAWGRYQKMKGYTPPAPDAPYWLPEFAPSQVEGQRITKEGIRTPSGQQWARTPQSTLAGLAGYVDWAGKRTWEDVTKHMTSMQPRSVAGGTQRRWLPARQ